jgi:hypothetical protein
LPLRTARHARFAASSAGSAFAATRRSFVVRMSSLSSGAS